MTQSRTPDPGHAVAVTGAGVVCSIAGSISELSVALRRGQCGITHYDNPDSPSIQFAAPLTSFSWGEALEPLLLDRPDMARRARRVLNNNNPSTCLSTCAAVQAYVHAGLGDGSQGLEDTGLIVAGNNLDQELISQNWHRFRQAGRWINPKYAITYQDSNQLGSLSEILALRGAGCTLGAASASGNAALCNAFHWIRSGFVRRCIVVGACTRFSPLELEAFALLGAATSGERHQDPDRVCRPFDKDHDGFVWGEASACLVLESLESAQARCAPELGEIVGCSLLLDGHHLPDPSVDGEIRAMRSALNAAGLSPGQIGYVNAHATSSPLGDRTECQALKAVFADHLGTPRINSTKSLVGHCMSAAGVLEAICSLIQLNDCFLHPNLNLEHPIDPDLHFASAHSTLLETEYALSNGFGFGGINSTLLLRKGGRP
jgi:malonyl-ACP decarboxylase